MSKSVHEATLSVRVQPRASRNVVMGWNGDTLKVKLTAPPVEGAANDAVVAFFADALGVPRRAVRIVSGDRGRQKRIAIAGVTTATVRALFPA